MNIDSIFENKQRRDAYKPRTKSYDVRVTLNKQDKSKAGFRARFAFWNTAFNAFKGHSYVEVSMVERLPNKIYFRLYDKRENLSCNKLKKSATSSCFTEKTLSKEAEKIYRMKWAYKTFTIQYDELYQLYYIELNDEQEE